MPSTRHTVGTVSSEHNGLRVRSRSFLSIAKTESGRFVVIDAHDHADTNEVRLIPVDVPTRHRACFWPAKPGSHTTYRITERR